MGRTLRRNKIGNGSKRARGVRKENKGGRTKTQLRIRDGKLKEVLQVASESIGL